MSKSFKDDNPAMHYLKLEEDNKVLKDNEITKADMDKAEEIERLKQQIKDMQMSNESKSQRVNLLMRPSLVKDIKAAAKDNEMSMNEFIEKAVLKYLQEKEI